MEKGGQAKRIGEWIVCLVGCTEVAYWLRLMRLADDRECLYIQSETESSQCAER